MTFTEAMDHVATGVELVGVAVLVVGLVWSAVRALRGVRRSDEGRAVYQVESEGMLPWRRGRPSRERTG